MQIRIANYAQKFQGAMEFEPMTTLFTCIVLQYFTILATCKKTHTLGPVLLNS